MKNMVVIVSLIATMLYVTIIGFGINYVHNWWQDNQISQRIETLANKNFPVK